MLFNNLVRNYKISEKYRQKEGINFVKWAKYRRFNKKSHQNSSFFEIIA